MTAQSVTPPRILVLWASESATNLGVAALARGSRDLLQRVSPGAEITFANYGARPAQVPWGRPRSLVRERVQSRFGMQDYFRSFDLVWDTRAGDSFADIYGLERLITMSMVHECARAAGAPIVMAPQTIGPFTTRRGRLLARWNLRRSRLVVARDPRSAAAAEALHRPADMTAADMVFAIEQPQAGPPRDVLVNVSGLLWSTNPHVDAAAYRRILQETIALLRADGREVTLLAHVLDNPTPDNDVPAARELAAQVGGDLEVVVPTDLDSVRETIAGARLLIGSRMHACLNALSVGTPAIPLAYSRKFAPLLDSVGWTTGFDLRTDDPATLPPQIVAAAWKVTAGQARAASAAGRQSLDALQARVQGLLPLAVPAPLRSGM